MYHTQARMFLGAVAVNATVIYHANCCDGFGAAWAFHHTVKCYQDVDYIAMNYGEVPDPARYADRDVFILDFSFPEKELREIAANAAHTVLLDHHKTAIEALTPVQSDIPNCTIILDTTRSGAMITWNFFSQEDAPTLIEYIQDRDLWKHEKPKTKEINALIAMTDKTFAAYDTLHTSLEFGQFYQCAIAGELLLKQYDRMVQGIVESTARPFSISGYEVLVCNCPGNFASDVGNVLAQRTGTFGATYFAASDGSHKFSLRSVGAFDVSAIAKQFGGGGHRNAAGFTLAAPIDNAGGSGVTIWNITPSEEC